MEPKIFLIKKAKDFKKLKENVLEKSKTMIGPDSVLDENMLIVKKESTWTSSKAVVTFTKKNGDVEITFSAEHSATGKAIGIGCVLALFGLILVAVPWILYEQDKTDFEKGMTNVLNYFATQSEG